MSSRTILRRALQSGFQSRGLQSVTAAVQPRMGFRPVGVLPNLALRPARQSRWFSEKPETADKTAPPENEASAADPAAGEEPPASEQAAVEEGPSRETQLEEEVASLKDQLLRSLAEQDNTRRIAKRDVDAARQFAIKSFAKSLLDVSDNLTRALEAVPEEMRQDKEEHSVLANLYEGIELTDRGLSKAFEMNGLVKYGVAGEPFDPNQHEALYEYVDPEKEPGTIGQVMKPGFLLNNRVLRPAEVGVIKKP